MPICCTGPVWCQKMMQSCWPDAVKASTTCNPHHHHHYHRALSAHKHTTRLYIDCIVQKAAALARPAWSGTGAERSSAGRGRRPSTTRGTIRGSPAWRKHKASTEAFQRSSNSCGIDRTRISNVHQRSDLGLFKSTILRPCIPFLGRCSIFSVCSISASTTRSFSASVSGLGTGSYLRNKSITAQELRPAN